MNNPSMFDRKRNFNTENKAHSPHTLLPLPFLLTSSELNQFQFHQPTHSTTVSSGHSMPVLRDVMYENTLASIQSRQADRMSPVMVKPSSNFFPYINISSVFFCLNVVWTSTKH